MPSPFPGMDPYLERPARWHPFHTFLVAEIARELEPLLPDRYYVSIEERTYLIVPDDPEAVRLPDVTVLSREVPAQGVQGNVAVLPPAVEVVVPAPDMLRERYLEIRDLEQDERAITVIEVLSPSNKKPGDGRDDYVRKRAEVLSSLTSLVEIDLLRSGPRMAALGAPAGFHYSILVCRASTRPNSVLYPFTVRDPIPAFPVPLLPGDPEPELALGPVLDHIYDRGRYRMRTDYSRPAVPPLEPADEAWADALLREKGLR